MAWVALEPKAETDQMIRRQGSLIPGPDSHSNIPTLLLVLMAIYKGSFKIFKGFKRFWGNHTHMLSLQWAKDEWKWKKWPHGPQVWKQWREEIIVQTFASGLSASWSFPSSSSPRRNKYSGMEKINHLIAGGLLPSDIMDWTDPFLRGA